MRILHAGDRHVVDFVSVALANGNNRHDDCLVFNRVNEKINRHSGDLATGLKKVAIKAALTTRSSGNPCGLPLKASIRHYDNWGNWRAGPGECRQPDGGHGP